MRKDFEKRHEFVSELDKIYKAQLGKLDLGDDVKERLLHVRYDLIVPILTSKDVEDFSRHYSDFKFLPPTVYQDVLHLFHHRQWRESIRDRQKEVSELRDRIAELVDHSVTSPLRMSDALDDSYRSFIEPYSHVLPRKIKKNDEKKSNLDQG